jgi:aryl-alcohol dehydrogenase-like predicted oxidoreductase
MGYGDGSREQWAFDYDDAVPFFKQALELGITFWDTANSCLNPLSLGCWPKISPEADNQHPKPLPEPDEASEAPPEPWRHRL